VRDRAAHCRRCRRVAIAPSIAVAPSISIAITIVFVAVAAIVTVVAVAIAVAWPSCLLPPLRCRHAVHCRRRCRPLCRLATAVWPALLLRWHRRCRKASAVLPLPLLRCCHLRRANPPPPCCPSLLPPLRYPCHPDAALPSQPRCHHQHHATAVVAVLPPPAPVCCHLRFCRCRCFRPLRRQVHLHSLLFC
jgi:hypothetical protein